MTDQRYYVLRTEKMSKPMYFAGIMPSNFGGAIGLAQTIFGAFDFDTREDAQEAIDDLQLGEDFTISECGDLGMSDSLKAGMN